MPLRANRIISSFSWMHNSSIRTARARQGNRIFQWLFQLFNKCKQCFRKNLQQISCTSGNCACTSHTTHQFDNCLNCEWSVSNYKDLVNLLSIILCSEQNEIHSLFSTTNQYLSAVWSKMLDMFQNPSSFFICAVESLRLLGRMVRWMKLRNVER